jgi:pyridoxine 5-phosphate synthase
VPTGTDRIEIYTGPYADAFDRGDPRGELDRIVATVRAAEAAGVGVNAGHDLTISNLAPLVHEAPQILEVSIGHHLTVRALEVGMEQAVRDYLRAAMGAP